MLVESLVQEVRYALRGVRRSPLFAVGVSATIGLGLGLFCSAFTILNAYILRPIDLPDPHELYGLSWDTETTRRQRFRLAEFEALRDSTPHFASLAAGQQVTVMQDAAPLPGLLVTGDYFQPTRGTSGTRAPARSGRRRDARCGTGRCAVAPCVAITLRSRPVDHR